MFSNRISQRLLECSGVSLEELVSNRQFLPNKEESLYILQFCNEKGEIYYDDLICRIKKVDYSSENQDTSKNNVISFTYENYKKMKLTEKIIETKERSFQYLQQKIIPRENQTLFCLEYIFIKRPRPKNCLEYIFIKRPRSEILEEVGGTKKRFLIESSTVEGEFINSFLGFFIKSFSRARIVYVEFTNDNKTPLILNFKDYHRLKRPKYILDTEKVIGYASLKSN